MAEVGPLGSPARQTDRTTLALGCPFGAGPTNLGNRGGQGAVNNAARTAALSTTFAAHEDYPRVKPGHPHDRDSGGARTCSVVRSTPRTVARESGQGQAECPVNLERL